MAAGELSFSAVKEHLRYPDSADGWVRPYVWEHSPRLHPIHRHDELELNLVVRGTGRYLLDDRRYDLGPDSLVWLFPDQEHILIDQSRDFRMWILVISPRALRRHCGVEPYRFLLELNPAGHFCRRLAEADARRLRPLLEDLDLRDDDARLNPGLAWATLSAWRMYQRAPDTLSGVRLHAAVERAANLIAADVDADLTAVARRSGLSHSRLSHLFRAQTGHTLASWRNRQRLERFFAHAAGGRKTLLAAALDAGFGSYAQFHRVFRQLTGVSPARWQRDAR
jgi:AraC-like DNA-binding protein